MRVSFELGERDLRYFRERLQMVRRGKSARAEDRIILGGTSKGGLLTSDFGGAFGLSSLMSLPGIIDATTGESDAYHGVQ